MLKLSYCVLEEMKKGQKLDLGLIDRLLLINQGKEVDFNVDENGITKLRDKVCVSDFPELKKKILEESHRSSLSIHPEANNMHQDLKKIFWWPGMKKDVAEFLYSCLTCQKLKIEHHKLSGLMQPLSILRWKWDIIYMDFVVGFPKTLKGSYSIWVVADRLTKSAHFVPIKINYPLQKLAEIYIYEIVKLHGILRALF